ncbi:hypothetical protein [Acidocella sp.]|jgi:hypothetical protein|uniref:hypothetical protein n=1 Tax=Acidocella sp. TaxID=50710 RepID=UPI00260627AC|nr:hypothetical protein [Acidocella sp.]
MNQTSARNLSEGLKTARLLMVLSSISPLFILWAIRGNSLIPDHYFISICALMVLLPNAFLWLRIRTAKRNSDRREVTVGTADDHRDHILVYLFAMLLPFYSEDLGTLRDLAATLAALSFIVFLFWHLNLHYMNLVFAVLGYRVFTVYPPADGNPLTGRTRYAVITRRVCLSPGETITTYRLSDTVYLEAE